MKKVYLANDETVIKRKRYAELLDKERGHDAYLWAMSRMRQTLTFHMGQDHHSMGWRDCLAVYSSYVIDAPIPDRGDAT